jgi:hypothetical protein
MGFEVKTPGNEGARKLRKRRFAPRYFQNPNPKYCRGGKELSVHSATAARVTVVK